MRAQGLPQETVLYGLREEREEWKGAFEIETSSGEITVGPNGSDILLIKVIHACHDDVCCMYVYISVHVCRQ